MLKAHVQSEISLTLAKRHLSPVSLICLAPAAVEGHGSLTPRQAAQVTRSPVTHRE